MGSADLALIRELIELQAPLRALPLAERRRHYERAESAFARGGSIVQSCRDVDAGGCRAEWVLPPRAPTQGVLVYLHGGGYCLGSPRSHRHLAAAIGHAAGVAVLSVDYRLAPEHAFPAAIQDALAAVGWLTARTRAPIAIAGDSAGGGLAIATMLALRDRGERLPCACICLSPWADLTCGSDAYRRLAARDPLLVPNELSWMADRYLQGTDPHHPLASPVFADLSGLPPLLVQVGTEEILLDDARSFADAARAAGVDVRLQEWSGMVHVWQWYHPVLEHGRRAIGCIGGFLADRVSPRRGAASGSAAMPRAASPIQQAHLRIAPWTSGRGYLSWVYQLNGPLDVGALARAFDQVVRRHEILRVRFERREGCCYQVVTPFRGGVLRFTDLSGIGKRDALEAAVADARSMHDTLSAYMDPRFRARLYTIDPKTAVLAMFVAEALVDSDSGGLLSAEITRAYAEHSGTVANAELPEVSQASHLDYSISHPPDPAALDRAREHWLRQARDAASRPIWPAMQRGGGANLAFQMTQLEWSRMSDGARALGSTPYVLVLTCLHVVLARRLGFTRLVAHSIVATRDAGAQAMIGNYHSPVRIDLRLDSAATLRTALSGTALAVADAVEHRELPAPLAFPEPFEAPEPPAEEPALRVAGDPLGDIRFYMFSSHGGPTFAGVRRRRFRLHGAPCADLSLSCVHGPGGRRDFVFSSTRASHGQLARISADLRAAIAAAIGGRADRTWTAHGASDLGLAEPAPRPRVLAS